MPDMQFAGRVRKHLEDIVFRSPGLDGDFEEPPLTPETLPQIPMTPVLISNGRMDPLVSAEETEHLAALLRSGGAAVTVAWQAAGHELTASDITTAREWLAQQPLREA